MDVSHDTKMAGIIILLGAQNDAEGHLSSIAKERCRLAIIEYTQRAAWVILPTGGFGAHFNRAAEPHAFYTRRYLLEQGVPAPAVLTPILSRSTIEDATLAKPVILGQGVRDLLVVTSDYHAERANFVFNRVFQELNVLVRQSRTSQPKKQLEQLVNHEKEALLKLKNSCWTF